MDPTGFLLHMTAQVMRLEVGFSGELLGAPLILQHHITTSWIKHVWVSTQECRVTLFMDFADYPPQRHGDIELMWLFIQSGLKQPELMMVNHYRMHLQVFLLSDIVLGSGEHILPQFWEHTHPADSSFDWPTTPQPSQAAWNTWRQALTQALHLGRQQRLALPLGKWLQFTSHGWLYHQSTNSLWHTDSTAWHQHGGIPQCTCQQAFHLTGQTDTPPAMEELEQATILRSGQKLVLTRCSPCESPQTGHDPCYCARIAEVVTPWKFQLMLKGSQRNEVGTIRGMGVCCL